MYLVELRPGKEELYRSIEELAAAIRSGDVDKHSRIYHRATSRWISVTLHPQFKAIVAEQPAPAEPPLPPLGRTSWTFFNAAAETLAGAELEAPSIEQAADAAPPAESGPDPDSEAGRLSRGWGRPLALCVAGGFLIMGMQLATSGPRPPWAVREAEARLVPVLPTRATAEPEQGAVSLASNRTSYVVHAEEDSPDSAAAAAAPDPAAETVLPAAPRIRVARALREALARPASAAPDSASERGTVAGMLRRWSAAHDSARTRLESGMRVARLDRLFAAARLAPGSGVMETRMSLAGLANFIRVYRQQQTTIDREYQDSFAVASRQLRWSPVDIRQWYARPRRSETPALAALTASLVEGIDSLLGVLDAQAGTYRVTEKAIAFEDTNAAREYMALRQRIYAVVDSAKAAGAGSGAMAQLLQAIGTTRLPQAS